MTYNHHNLTCEACGYWFNTKDKPASKHINGHDVWYYCQECTNEADIINGIDRPWFDLPAHYDN